MARPPPCDRVENDARELPALAHAGAVAEKKTGARGVRHLVGWEAPVIDWKAPVFD